MKVGQNYSSLGQSSELSYGLEPVNHGLIPDIIKRFLSPPKHPDQLQGQPTQPPIQWVLEALSGDKGGMA